MHKKMIPCALLVSLMATACSINASAQHVLDIQDSVKRNIYLIRARISDKGTATRVLTGFRVRGLRGFVTALHGVADADSRGDIRVFGLDDAPQFKGKMHIALVDVEHDVAFLTSNDSTTISDDGLDADTSQNWIHLRQLRMFSHPFGISSVVSSRVALRETPRQQLRELVPPTDFDALGERGSPHIDGFVISVEDVLHPGDSGSPLLDDSGHVIGVSNGGLGGGSTKICWAIPWCEIHWYRPDTSRVLKRLQSQNPTFLFSLDGESTTRPNGARNELQKDSVDYNVDGFIAQAGRGDVRLVEKFLDAGMFVDVQDANGFTALMMAARNGRVDIVVALLRRDANVHMRDDRGRTAMLIALERWHAEVADLLREAGSGSYDLQPETTRTRASVYLMIHTTTTGSATIDFSSKMVTIFDVPIYAGFGIRGAYLSSYSYDYNAIWISGNVGIPIVRYYNGGMIEMDLSWGKAVTGAMWSDRYGLNIVGQIPLSHAVSLITCIGWSGWTQLILDRIGQRSEIFEAIGLGAGVEYRFQF
ncbi:MAG: ankyrin repeat-containing protein [Chlorobi bacterium]|nr:ankyrin repeat-containing protein [Chlorobiota bacterium]